MVIKVNLRHLEDKTVHLDGEISPDELGIKQVDEMVQAKLPLQYDLEVERSGETLLVTGKLELTLDCECVRCLKPFPFLIQMDPYEAVVPLEGEEKAPVTNDLVDLTPYVREDILLAFPPHPVCQAECDRLPSSSWSSEQTGGSAQGKQSAWDELNKLKF